jgi:hypothetical protein
MQPGMNEAFARLLARHHHQVLAHGQRGKLMRNLEGAQQALGEQFVRRQPEMSSPSSSTRPEVGL